MTARRVYYEGKVQGVGFRYSVRRIAAGFEVVGAVENLPDGRVQLEAMGDEAEVRAFLEAILDSHLRSHIRSRVEIEIPPLTGARGFTIR